MAIEFTPNQTKGITHRGHDVLVSASAGSGKTAVLVERIVRLIEAGQDITRLLVVTFTNAATAEMKLKLQVALKNRLAHPTAPLTTAQQQHLKQQIAVSNAASIMTLDAFSLQVVQQYYYVLGLDPNFRLLSDDTERMMLEETVWARLREVFLQSSQAPAFTQLLDNFSTNPTQDGLADTVFKLLDFANVTTQPLAWLEALAEPYAPEGFTAFFGRELWPDLKQALAAMVTTLEALVEDLNGDPALKKAQAAVTATLAPLRAAATLNAPTYAEAYAAVQAVTWPRWPGGKVDDPLLKAAKDSAKDARNAVKMTFDKQVQAALTILPKDLDAVLPQAHAMMQTLSTVTREFELALSAEKQARGLQDFGDIAHNALAILEAADPTTGKPVAANFKAAFDEVLVDEYQDINHLQEALLTAVSQDAPGNRFMVGDAKQSIYGFRLADPALFLDKYQRFQPAGGNVAAGERVDLADNFRSSPNVLAFTNLVFSQIMDQTVGQLDYDQAATLKYGADYLEEPYFPADYAPTTEVLLTETQAPEDDQEEALAKDEGQIQAVIARIQELVTAPEATLFDRDTGRYRRITYKDIKLLARSRSQNILIQSAFAAAGVPVIVTDAQNYFKTTELMTMLSLLRLIDNPKQEIPLAAVLRSPLVGLAADDLARIRLAAPQAPYDEAFAQYLANPAGVGADVQAAHRKAQAFAQQLKALRQFAQTHELSDLIWRIYAVTGYLDFVGGLPGGLQRQANLRALAKRAASYENGGFKGLFAFIHFIELMQKRDKDLATPVIADPEANAVTLMTIHASKGLEFPVVFLLAADKKFNQMDLNARVIMTNALSGVQWLDQKTRVNYELPQFQVAKRAKANQLLAEEMRLLYVALTRAQQRLIIVGSTADYGKLQDQWASYADLPHQLLPASLRAQAHSYLDWIGMAIARHPDVAEAIPSPISLYGAKVAVTVVIPGPPKPISLPTEATSQPPLTLDLETWFKWRYPFEEATHTAGFQSVTEIKRAFNDPTATELVVTNRLLGSRRYLSDFKVPVFLNQEETVLNAAVGTATHLVLQHLDWHQPVSAVTVQATIDRLVHAGQLTASVAAAIQVPALVQFGQSALGQLLHHHATTLHTEVPFSLLLPARQVFQNMADSDDDVLIHGIIDGFVTTDAGVTLFDYKTDRDRPQAIVARYRGQLNLYALALSRLQKQPVTHRYLVLLAHDQVIEIENSGGE